MGDKLSKMRILIFVGDMVEDLEFHYPRIRLMEAGVHVTAAGEEAEKVYTGKHGMPARSDAAIQDMIAADFDGLVIPGGYMPDKLRRNNRVLQLVRDFHDSGKMIASICHAGWILISAGVCRGANLTSTPAIRDDLVNAKANWLDQAVVVDRHFISSRGPQDLGDFMKAILKYLEKSESGLLVAAGQKQK